MSLLEALGEGIASVCTTSCGIAQTLEGLGAAMVVAPDVDSIADAVRTLLGSPEHREQLSSHAQEAVRQAFSIESVVDQLEAIYGEL
jgi:glycosyltransferase involved in cell wall biosynthesis